MHYLHQNHAKSVVSSSWLALPLSHFICDSYVGRSYVNTIIAHAHRHKHIYSSLSLEAPEAQKKKEPKKNGMDMKDYL